VNFIPTNTTPKGIDGAVKEFADRLVALGYKKELPIERRTEIIQKLRRELILQTRKLKGDSAKLRNRYLLDLCTINEENFGKQFGAKNAKSRRFWLHITDKSRNRIPRISTRKR
jgi:hypothetical protein